MSERSNCGYTIVQSLMIGDCKFVLGHNPEAPNPYVTWKCSNGIITSGVIIPMTAWLLTVTC